MPHRPSMAWPIVCPQFKMPGSDIQHFIVEIFSGMKGTCWWVHDVVQRCDTHSPRRPPSFGSRVTTSALIATDLRTISFSTCKRRMRSARPHALTAEAR